MFFTDAIREGHLKNLSSNQRSLVIGLGMTYPNEGLSELYPDQVFDTPVSELALSGMAVGLASQGFFPTVVHGRIEFALLAMDQILTQASRWNYMFGGNYACPVSFRIAIGRQWGNGPQHTANYHSIFMQSPGLDIFIPSTPKEVFDHIRYISKIKNPSVILEHRWLYKTSQEFDTNSEIPSKLNQGSLYNSSVETNILLVTYADGLIDAIKAKEYLEKIEIGINVLNISSFNQKGRISSEIHKIISDHEEVIFLDTAPIEFGIMSGVAGLNSFKQKKIRNNFHYLSPPFHPCPTAPSLTKDYYVSYDKIIEFIAKLSQKDNLEKITPSFDEINLWPEFDFTKYNPDLIY